MYTYISRSYHTVGSLWILGPVTEDGLNDCGRALSFTSVNLITANVIRSNSSVGLTYSLKFCPGLTLNYTYVTNGLNDVFQSSELTLCCMLPLNVILLANVCT